MPAGSLSLRLPLPSTGAPGSGAWGVARAQERRRRQLWAPANLGTQGGCWPGLQCQVSRLWCGCRVWAAPAGLALCGLGCPPHSLYPCPDPEPGTRAQPRALQNPGAFCPTRQGWGRQRPPAGLRAAAALPAGAVIWENQGWASFCQEFARPPSRGVPSEPLSGPAFQVLWWDAPRQEAPSRACRTAPPRLVGHAVWPGRRLLDVASWWPGAPPAGCVPGGQQSLRHDFQDDCQTTVSPRCAVPKCTHFTPWAAARSGCQCRPGPVDSAVCWGLCRGGCGLHCEGAVGHSQCHPVKS